MLRGRIGSSIGLALVALGLLSAAAVAGEIPATINYQGRLLDPAGVPLTGSHEVIFRIFDDATAGAALWAETRTITADSAGVFAVLLGAVDSIGIAFDGPRWLEVEVGGEILAPRREMASVPFAFQSRNSHLIEGFHPDAFADSSHGHSSLDAVDGDPAGAVFVDDAGNVGVGTQTPSAKLDVAGTAKMAGFALPTGAAGGRVLTSDASGTGTWQAPQAGTDGDWTVSGDNMYSAVPGNVGIGVTSPIYRLAVTDTSTGPNRTAIFGSITSGADGGEAIAGLTYSSSTAMPSTGVVGLSMSVLGSGVGAGGGSFGPTGKGIEAIALHSSGVNYAIRAQTYSPNGFAGYFLGGRNYFSGKVGIGIDSPRYPLHVTNSSSAESSTAICGHVYQGYDAIGVYGRTDSPSQFRPGAAVVGYASSPLGSASGVNGTAAGYSGIALEGRASNATGPNFGVRASTASPLGYAGYFLGGRNYFEGNVGIGTDNPTYPLVVLSNAPVASSPAILGSNATMEDRTIYGITGDVFAPNATGHPGAGVFGSVNVTEGSHAGVLGRSGCLSGSGVVGEAGNTTGVNYGVRGRTASPNGYAGYFTGGRNYFEGNVGIGAINPTYPLTVVSTSVPDLGAVIYGGDSRSSGKGCGGVWGLTVSSERDSPGFGVRGSANAYHGCGKGVIGESWADSGAGVYAYARSTSDVNYGIMAATDSPDGYAGFFLGPRSYFSGKVGLGIYAPLKKLHIKDDASGILQYAMKLENAAPNVNGTATGILFKVDGGAEDRGKGGIVYERTDTWNRGDFHILQRTETGTWTPATLADAVVTIKNNGNVGIGTKTPGYKLQVGTAGDGSEARANAWNLLSSREYKQDIEPLGPAQCQDILEKAAATEVVTYRFKADPAAVQHLGVIAEESPSEIVAPDGKGVSLGDYTAFLLAAIKAQQAQIEELRQQVDELRTEVEARR
jgi:hypothetical protein